MNRKSLIIAHIKERLTSLEELGKLYSEEKTNSLAEKLANSDKTLNEIFTLIDNKFSNQIRKIKHNNNLASLKDYYLSRIDKLKKGNNCYLLSYDQGVKIIEQAHITIEKDINDYMQLVTYNNNKKGYIKKNSISNDFDIIMSDIAFLLKIEYAPTYRVFNESMEPTGVLNLSFEHKNERFLNFEETLQFIKEESPKFILTQELLEYHDQKIKQGLKIAHSDEEIIGNIEYVLKIFSALPDITKENIDKLKRDYLNMKVFELLTNSINNNLSNFGIIVNKEKLTYTYRLSPSYNKHIIELPGVSPNQTICNFFVIDKKELLTTIVNHYYNDTKELLSLIVKNEDTLIPIINQVIKEHLEYSEYTNYYKIINNNIKMIIEVVTAKKKIVPDTKEDIDRNMDNDILYNNRIAPFIDQSEAEEYFEDKGSIVLTAVIVAVLFITIGIIALAIYSISKMNM